MDRPLTGCAVVVLATVLAAHAGGLWGGFVYDDHRFVERNPAVRDLSQAVRYFTDPSTASAGQGIEPDVWRPLRTLAYALDYAVFGLDPRGWHAASILLHAANAVLVLLLLLSLLGGRAREGPMKPPGPGRGRRLAVATLAAAAFGAHPATVEAVAWVSSRGDLLAWTLVLLALEATRQDGALRTACGAVLVGLACLAKESAAVAFLLVPLRDAALPAAERPRARTTAVRTVLLAGVTGLWLLARQAALPGAPDLPWLAQTQFPDEGRAAAARGFLASVGWYAGVVLAPVGFAFDRNVHVDPVPVSWGDPAVVLGAGILASVAWAAVRAWRRGPRAAAWGWTTALVALGPVSNVLVPLKAYAAERFLYPVLPSLAAVAAAGGLALLARLPRGGRRALGAAACAGLVALCVLAGERTKAWRDDETLWTAALRANPMNPRAHEGLGFERARQGHWSQGETSIRTYLEFQPLDGKAWALLSEVYLSLYRSLATATVDPATGVETRIEPPRELLAKAIEGFQRALDAWQRLGLARGRGDLLLLRTTVERWRTAALEYGDLEQARRANQALAADDAARGPRAAYGQRRLVPILALMALDVREAPDPARDLDRRRLRARVLRDAGLDPSLSDEEARAALLPALGTLLAERPDDTAIRAHRARILYARLRGSPADEDLATLEADLRALVAADPRDPGLRATLEEVSARRGGR